MIRLARMLHEDSSMLLNPSYVSPDLQKLFQLSPDAGKDNNPEEQSPAKGDQRDGAFHHILRTGADLVLQMFTARKCYGALPTFKEILRWKVPRKNLDEYIERVDVLLTKVSNSPKIIREIPEKRREMFHRMIKAMAWQESCYRQFVVKGDKLTYLLSYNQSSVGLMQVNERVWRGHIRSRKPPLGHQLQCRCRLPDRGPVYAKIRAQRQGPFP